MPGSYTIDTARRVVLSCGWGVIAGDELLAHPQAIGADPRFEPSFRQLADLRGVTGFDFGIGTIREVAKLNPFGQGSRRAIVIGNDLAYRVIQMYQLLRDSGTQEILVFRELEPAVEWLGFVDDAAEVTAALLALQAPAS